MDSSSVDPVVEAAMAFAEMIAKAHAAKNGDMADLFATFVGMVVQEDHAIGLHCLETVDQWFSA
jgi:hypothetical protein